MVNKVTFEFIKIRQMKLAPLIVFAVFFQLSVLAQFSSDRYHPKEIIKQYSIDTCKIFNVNSDSSQILQQQIVYDIKGNEIANIRNYQKFSYLYFYNENGYKVAQYFVPFGESPFEKDTFIYDQSNNLIKSLTTDRNNRETKRNEYDFTNNILAQERFFIHETLQVTSTYHYDSQQRIKEVDKSIFGNPDGKWVYNYTDNHLDEFLIIDNEGDTTLLQKHKYNDKNLKTDLEIYNRHGELTQLYKTTYDSKGLIDFEESYVGIRNNDMNNCRYEKAVYKYTYRK